MLFRATILAALAAAVYGQAVAPPDVCLVCGDGMVVTKPDAIVAIPNPLPNFPLSTTTIPCSTLQEWGLAGQISLSKCTSLPGLTTSVCGCAPVDLPVVVPPASNNCPPVPATGCSICGPDLCISNPDAIFSFPGQLSTPCGILQEGGLTGLIPLDQCPFVAAFVDMCDCGTDGVPVAAPTKAPTEAPVTPAPTGAPDPTGAPVTPAPTPDGDTAAPTTLAPTLAPTTLAPTTLAPTTLAPTEAPTTLAPVPAPTTATVPAPTPYPVFMLTPAPFFSVPTTSDGKKGKNMMGGGGGGGGGMSGKKRALRENSDIRGN